MKRFKTEKEFIKEFGEDWREDVEYRWIYEMDHLFGEKCKNVDDYGWEISDDMLIGISPIQEWDTQFKVVCKELKKLNDIEKRRDGK